MMKKLAAILALALAGALLLTGCVAAAPALDESQIDRPTVVVTLNGEALEATVEPEETAEATAEATAPAQGRWRGPGSSFHHNFLSF